MTMHRCKSFTTLAKEKAAAKVKAKEASGKGRPTARHPQPAKNKYPWEEIETFFVHGEEAQGPNGAPFRTQPSFSEVARKFNAPVSTVSQRANTKDVAGKTWYDKRNEYLSIFKANRDTRIAEEIVDQEVAFRKSTLAAAQLVVQHAFIQLHRGLRKDAEGNLRSALDADTLSKLAASARKGQEVGLVAMDRDPEAEGGRQGEDDWTLMRRVRAGCAKVAGLPHE